ncbi:7-deoxyloganetic acid glucosyltransferase-like [Mercurialis annua]|uniref:7-deoxyloganetic acid glucosyltransferase-like n=1 Tax=Mercurialis annua TaxID=3986 RepID=UPI0021608AEF|nr:7-deoxyloganetic acid glucosyltransferase-like [Mercurialis annua]
MATLKMKRVSTTPHVLIFPAPGQGHVNPMLKLAELLGLAGLQITFLIYQQIHDDLTRYSDIKIRFSKYSKFQFKTFPNFLPEDRHGRRRFIHVAEEVRNFIEQMNLRSKPVFEKMMIDHQHSSDNPPFTCVIGDSLMGFVQDVAGDLGIPVIQFNTASSCFFWALFSLPRVLSAGELPITGKKDMDRLITQVPGMETFLRCQDLPGPFRVSDTSDPTLQTFLGELRTPQTLIINTFEDLEAPILSQIRTRCPKTYPIGPLHELLKDKLKKTHGSSSSANDLCEVDITCMKWLDDQPSQSVLYVSFGSFTRITMDQFIEFRHGIIKSNTRFLWVIRPGSVTSTNDNPEQYYSEELFQEGKNGNGYIVKWAPQEKVLGHKAIGGFLTHSGWNSTLESIVSGVPMICWPYFGDQQINSRFVGEIWKIGLDMKDLCDREIVEKMVNDLMVNRREEFVRSSAIMAELARKSVEEGGSSSSYLDRLIEDIRMMSIE